MGSIVSTISEAVSTVAPSGKVGYDVGFPHLGIFIKNLGSAIRIGNYTIAFYGIIISIGMLIAFLIVSKTAKKFNINEDIFYDIFIIIIVLGIIGARAYYVIFKWDYYQIHMHEILDIRAGGLAIYGGIILGIIGIFIYCLIRKIQVIKVFDLTAIGVALGQAIGRYGNFFNTEAFGEYTDNIFAMRIRKELVSNSADISRSLLLNPIVEEGIEYIQVHPTFFYESTLNIILFIVMFIMIRKKHKFDGQIMATYFIGYGIIRFFVESLRTDSLMFMEFRISQIVSIVLIAVGLLIFALNHFKIKPFDKVNELNENMRVKIAADDEQESSEEQINENNKDSEIDERDINEVNENND